MPRRNYTKDRKYESTNDLMKEALGLEYPKGATQEQINKFIYCIGEDKGYISKLYYDDHIEVPKIAELTGYSRYSIRCIIDDLGRLYRYHMDDWYMTFYGIHMPITLDTKIFFMGDIPINTRSKLINRGFKTVRDIVQYSEEEFSNMSLDTTYVTTKHRFKVGPTTTSRFKTIFDKYGISFKNP